MREIKFRAWDLIAKKFLYLSEGLCPYPYYEIFCHTPDSRPWELSQYTGLHDRNSKEIWEGDIVRELYFGLEMVGEIVWGGYSWALKGKVKNRMGEWKNWYAGDTFKHGSSSHHEVIGNIYETPYLLK